VVGFILISAPDEAGKPGNREMRSRSVFLVLFLRIAAKVKSKPNDGAEDVSLPGV